VHVSLRARDPLPSLRSLLPEISRAIAQGHKEKFRVTEFSIQIDHIHLIVESDDKRSLALGTRGLIIRMARAINRALRSKGSVWEGRYFARELKSPTEMRRALAYVLMNTQKHRPNRTGVDFASSAPWFDGLDGWTALDRDACPSARSQTWLGTRGWRRAGGVLRAREAPRRFD
jgi:REP element-mobilizing transposase RayT